MRMAPQMPECEPATTTPEQREHPAEPPLRAARTQLIEPEQYTRRRAGEEHESCDIEGSPDEGHRRRNEAHHEHDTDDADRHIEQEDPRPGEVRGDEAADGRPERRSH